VAISLWLVVVSVVVLTDSPTAPWACRITVGQKPGLASLQRSLEPRPDPVARRVP